MLAVSWLGNLLRLRGRLETTRWFLWITFLSFPAGFVAMLTGWFTAEVGRQPWVVYGLLRTKDAVTPSLVTGDVLFSLVGYVVVYALFVVFGSLLHLQAVARRTDVAATPIRAPRPTGPWRSPTMLRAPPAAKLEQGNEHAADTSRVLGRASSPFRS